MRLCASDDADGASLVARMLLTEPQGRMLHALAEVLRRARLLVRA